MSQNIILLQFLFIYFVNGSYVWNCRCGKTAKNHVKARVVGGTNLPPDEHPWLAAIFKRNLFRCGGTLINNRYVLTAGHCVKWTRNGDLTVGLGLHSLSGADKEILLKVKRTIVHPEFTSHLLHDTNDIALVELARSVRFRNNIRPVCLPHPDSIYSGVTAMATGWGRSERRKLISELPMSVEVKVMNESFCLDSLIGDQITDGMLCAYYEGRDSCQGDSGGPLVFERNTASYELIGIISWGIGCGEKGIPSVYTKVTKYLGWIEKETPNGVYCAINY